MGDKQVRLLVEPEEVRPGSISWHTKRLRKESYVVTKGKSLEFDANKHYETRITTHTLETGPSHVVVKALDQSATRPCSVMIPSSLSRAVDKYCLQFSSSLVTSISSTRHNATA